MKENWAFVKKIKGCVKAENVRNVSMLKKTVRLGFSGVGQVIIQASNNGRDV